MPTQKDKEKRDREEDGRKKQREKEAREKAETDQRFREIREVISRNEITRGITPEKLRVIIEELGPTYIKLGQIMSLHSDILPKAYCDELMKLNSEVPPMPFSEVEEVLNHSYRTNWREVFETIDEVPLGSASIAQVHKARLLTGEDVIVKVERKGIYDTMARDIRLLKRIVRRLPPVGQLRNLVDLEAVIDELWTVAQEEMNFLKEAANMEEFAANNAEYNYIYVPKLYREHTTGRALVMEYVQGIPINDKTELLARGYDLDEIGNKFAHNFINQIMNDGFFHADPHPGNVHIRDGKIVWLDMGMMGRLTERERRIMMRGVQGIGLRDVSMVTDAVIEIGNFHGTPDRDQLYRDIREFIEEYGNISMGNVDIAEVLEAMMEVMKKNHVGLPHGMTMLVRGMAHLEGVLADISPDISMIQIAASSAASSVMRQIDWQKEAGRTARHLYRSAKKTIELPSLAADIMKEYLEGQSRFNLKLDASREFEDLINSAIRNIVIGMCIVALLLSSSILCLTGMKPQVLGIPFLGFLGYLTAFVSVAFFLVRFIIRKVRRHKRK